VLLAIMLGIVVWNRSLHALAERRGRELTKETISHVESELKVSERTRLAVELHDTLAQYLTGAIMEIRTGSRLGGALPPEAQEHFTLSQKTLESCRQELRNCLWDLRNRALEMPTMDAAIRQTLTPHVKGIDLTVRFAVPRETISDNTAHAILRIIRELVINATRHGRATAIKVAGAVEDGKLLFSVRDNGCGFDPESAPSIEDGHFGIQGIRERIAPFNGDFKIESVPGKGSKATISLTLPLAPPPAPSHKSHSSQ
jgi:signal transduction histidine kinase